MEEAGRQSIRVYGAGPYRSSLRNAAPALIVGYGGLPESKVRLGVERLVAVLEKYRARVTRKT